MCGSRYSLCVYICMYLCVYVCTCPSQHGQVVRHQPSNKKFVGLIPSVATFVLLFLYSHCSSLSSCMSLAQFDQFILPDHPTFNHVYANGVNGVLEPVLPNPPGGGLVSQRWGCIMPRTHYLDHVH